MVGSRRFMLGAAMSIFARSVRAPSGNSPARIRVKRSRFSLDRAAAVRAVASRLVPPAAIPAHLVALQVVDVGQPLPDQRDGALVRAARSSPRRSGNGRPNRTRASGGRPRSRARTRRPRSRGSCRPSGGCRARRSRARCRSSGRSPSHGRCAGSRSARGGNRVWTRPRAPAGGLVGGDDLPDEVESGRFGRGNAHGFVPSTTNQDGQSPRRPIAAAGTQRPVAYDNASASLRCKGGSRRLSFLVVPLTRCAAAASRSRNRVSYASQEPFFFL